MSYFGNYIEPETAHHLSACLLCSAIDAWTSRGIMYVADPDLQDTGTRFSTRWDFCDTDDDLLCCVRLVLIPNGEGEHGGHLQLALWIVV